MSIISNVETQASKNTKAFGSRKKESTDSESNSGDSFKLPDIHEYKNDLNPEKKSF